jgi:hypothetical protein
VSELLLLHSRKLPNLWAGMLEKSNFQLAQGFKVEQGSIAQDAVLQSSQPH